MREELCCLMSALKTSVSLQTRTRIENKQPRSKNPNLQQHLKHNPPRSPGGWICHPFGLELQDPFLQGYQPTQKALGWTPFTQLVHLHAPTTLLPCWLCPAGLAHAFVEV